jgi:hypothetical protein
MKKLFFVALIALGCNYGFGQNNLEFNQALYGQLSATISTASAQNIGTITVPAGKVWKIEARSVIRDNNAINVGSTGVTIGSLGVWFGSGETGSFTPVWLPEGTYNVWMSAANTSLTYVFTYSGIEFNVVP